MDDFTTEILKTLANKGDLNEWFRVHLEKAVSTLLKTALTAFLDYEKYDRIGFKKGNSRNGSYDRTVKTEYGELHLQIPRSIKPIAGPKNVESVSNRLGKRIIWCSVTSTWSLIFTMNYSRKRSSRFTINAAPWRTSSRKQKMGCISTRRIAQASWKIMRG